MTSNDIGKLRLHAQHITDPLKAPEDVVKQLLAMQAQDYSGALWSIGLRTSTPALSVVQAAISERRIVRTWPMRGTLHFLHADDVHWMVDLLAPRATNAAKSRRINQLGLTDAIVEDAERIIRSELKGGRSIVRGDVVTLLQAVKGMKIDNQHTQHLMRNFGERGVICFGPNEGKQPTFVLLNEWVEPGPAKPRVEALAELAQRYFHSHGPATLKDFAGWGMMTMTDAKAGLESAKSALQAYEIDGTVYYAAPDVKPDPGHHVELLPGFDEYVLGYKDRSAVLSSEYSNRIVPGGNGMFLATVVIDGKVAGLWRRTVRARDITHQYELFDGSAQSGYPEAERTYDQFMRT